MAHHLAGVVAGAVGVLLAVGADAQQPQDPGQQPVPQQGLGFGQQPVPQPDLGFGQQPVPQQQIPQEQFGQPGTAPLFQPQPVPAPDPGMHPAAKVLDFEVSNIKLHWTASDVIETMENRTMPTGEPVQVEVIERAYPFSLWARRQRLADSGEDLEIDASQQKPSQIYVRLSEHEEVLIDIAHIWDTDNQEDIDLVHEISYLSSLLRYDDPNVQQRILERYGPPDVPSQPGAEYWGAPKPEDRFDPIDTALPHLIVQTQNTLRIRLRDPRAPAMREAQEAAFMAQLEALRAQERQSIEPSF